MAKIGSAPSSYALWTPWR